MSPELLERIAERAADLKRRTYISGAEASARPVDLGKLIDDFKAHAAPGAQGLLGAIGQVGGMLGKLGGVTAMTAEGPVQFGGDTPDSAIGDPPEKSDIETAERAIGNSLPEALRQLYAIGDGGFGPGSGLYSLDQLATKYQGLTETPFGPLDQTWPGNLLPIFDEEPGWACLDLGSGEVVRWDPEEIENEESEEDWANSFRVAFRTLGEAMEQWLDKPTFEDMAERARADAHKAYAAAPLSPVTGYPMMLEPRQQAESEIQFLTHSPDLRQDFGLPEEGWKEEVWRRHGLSGNPPD